MRQPLKPGLLIALLGLFVACSSGDGAPDSADAAGSGADAPGDAAEDSGADGSGEPDAPGPDTGDGSERCDNGTDDDGDGVADCADLEDCSTAPSCQVRLGMLGERCAAGTDCMSGICFAAGGYCVEPCSDACPAPDFACRDAGIDGERVSVCARVSAPACTGCFSGFECGEGACVGGPLGNYCAPLCATTLDCPGDFVCGNDAIAGYCLPAAGPCGPYQREVCANGVDDDGDFAIDCGDTDCTSDPVCGGALGEVCANGLDDDLDGAVDCLDVECFGGPSCFEVCDNGVDDDLDQWTDCADVDCLFTAICGEDCLNGVDDNGNGLVDCADFGCGGSPGCVEDCANGTDDDADGTIDCRDGDCELNTGCAEDCLNGFDDDGDGTIDCEDTYCRFYTACREVCDNRIDDDADLATDCADRDCLRSGLCPESCDNGVDDNANGDTDCADDLCIFEEICIGSPRVRVRLTWEQPGDPDQTDRTGSDLDLHLLNEAEPGCWGDGNADCFYSSRFAPVEWGDRANPADDAEFKLDDVDGAGPELIVVDAPADGQYRVGVMAWSLLSLGPVVATAEVYVDGAVAFAASRELSEDRQFWEVATLSWPAGTLTAIDQVTVDYPLCE